MYMYLFFTSASEGNLVPIWHIRYNIDKWKIDRDPPTIPHISEQLEIHCVRYMYSKHSSGEQTAPYMLSTIIFQEFYHSQ